MALEMRGWAAFMLSLVFASGVILFVHDRQRAQTARMRAGVLRELRLEAEQRQRTQPPSPSDGQEEMPRR
jgi:hypothetical protein